LVYDCSNGEATGQVFDSSYQLVINGVEVFQGTSPEYGRWVVLKDLTLYSSLFKGDVEYSFSAPSVVIKSSFLSWITLYFYPTPSGSKPPSEPNTIIPLWSCYCRGTPLTAKSPSSTVQVNIPNNVVRATLQLYVYGFGFDEFWYSNEPSFRDVIVSVDSNPIASILPFPYINTGGIDLFMWRPITGVFTLDDPPYTVDATPALGMLEGSHTLSVTVENIAPYSTWLVSGALLLYTTPQAGQANTLSCSFSAPQISTQTNPTFTYSNQSANLSYSYSSSIPLSPNRNLVASETVTQSFQNNQTFNAVWENITGDETTNTHVEYVINTPTGSTVSDIRQTISYPLSLDTGFTFSVTSTTNGDFPMCGVFSIYLYNLLQQWHTLTTITNTTDTQTTTTRQNLLDTVNATDGVTSGTIELISPTAGIITGITYISANTTKIYIQTQSPLTPYTLYVHIISGASNQPPPPYFAETILVDKVISRP